MSSSEMRYQFGTRVNAIALAVSAMAVIVSAGCGGTPAPELIPVVGKVTIDGKPAKEGAVAFRDVSTGAIQPAGLITEDGSYKIYSGQQEGAPAGEYRVVVFVRKTPRTPSGEIAGLPTVIVNKRFTDANSTPLKITVQEGSPAGAYDLAVTH